MMANWTSMMAEEIKKNRFRVFWAAEWIALADGIGEEMREELKMTKYLRWETGYMVIII